MKTPHFILEIANVHSGKKAYLQRLIKIYSKLDYPNLGIKFQPFKFDFISLKDYEWYETYKKLFISEKNWNDLIEEANNKIGKVWLDLFDIYGIKILKNNIKNIFGLKIQASVIENIELFDSLKKLNLKEKKLMINVSGFDIDELEEIYDKFIILNVNELIFQFGYQSYPTKASDIALNKIHPLKKAFPKTKLCFADHLSAEDNYSIYLPSIALSAGCDMIEKHICIDRNDTEYDYHSALEFKEAQTCVKNIQTTLECFSNNFIPKSEQEYLNASIQVPVLSSDINAGQIIAKSDIYFRRTKSSGLTYKEVINKQKDFEILKKDLKKNSVLKLTDFKKSKIGVIVACRLKSSRLEKKAILPIDNIPSVERCLINCEMIEDKDIVVLATSDSKEDNELQSYTLNNKVKFWQGDPEDVISRYIGACEKYNIDVIIRVTADCCLISPEITKILIKSHFESGADYTAAREFAVGTSPEIYNYEALKRVIKYKGNAKYSEYMTWYMKNNSEIFKVNIIDLPTELIRDYRLTLDYYEDLEMFSRLYEKINELNLSPNLYNVFKILDEYPEIPIINNHLGLVYQTDQELINKLIINTKIELKNSKK